MRNGKKRSDKKMPETIDGETGRLDPTPRAGEAGDGDKPARRIDLSSLRDIRLEMAVCYRAVDSGEIESSDGSRRVFMLRQIADVIVNAELERRVAELEERRGLALPAPGQAADGRTLN